MTEENSLEIFEEMFDLKSKDMDNGQAEEYGNSTESDEDFDTLAAEMSGEIEALSDKGVSIGEEKVENEKENVHDIVRDVAATPPPQEDDMFADEGDDMFIGDDNSLKDDLDAMPAEELKEEVDKTIEEIHPTWEENSGGVNKAVTNEAELTGGEEVVWTFDSPAPMWDSFYAQKRKMINYYMIGGQVEYTRWINEMSMAKVEMRSEIFDQELMVKQMEEVQQYRERMKFIAIRVNNQYFMFKRFEEMLRGFLAKVQYMKPQIKQEGLVMEHMQDIVLYLSRLETLHDSVIKVERTLAGAFDVLSRKVTISMELSPAERKNRKEDYERGRENRKDFSIVKPPPEDLSAFDKFDDLPEGARVQPGKVIVGAIGWGEL